MKSTDLKISRAEKKDFPYIQEKIVKYCLDSENIEWTQFFVARMEDKIVAFGRIIDRGDTLEIASLGVDYYHRKKGIGKKMVLFLIQEAKRKDPEKPIYGVTHVKGFVGKCGFTEVKDNYPVYFDEKRRHCKLDASKISVMKWNGDLA